MTYRDPGHSYYSQSNIDRLKQIHTGYLNANPNQMNNNMNMNRRTFQNEDGWQQNINHLEHNMMNSQAQRGQQLNQQPSQIRYQLRHELDSVDMNQTKYELYIDARYPLFYDIMNLIQNRPQFKICNLHQRPPYIQQIPALADRIHTNKIYYGNDIIQFIQYHLYNTGNGNVILPTELSYSMNNTAPSVIHGIQKTNMGSIYHTDDSLYNNLYVYSGDPSNNIMPKSEVTTGKMSGTERARLLQLRAQQSAQNRQRFANQVYSISDVDQSINTM